VPKPRRQSDVRPPPAPLPPQALAEASRSDLATGSSTKPRAVCPGPRSFSERASPRPRCPSPGASPTSGPRPLLFRRRRLLKLRAPTLPPARPPNRARCAPDREASASERRRDRGAQAPAPVRRPAPARSLPPQALAEASRSDLATGSSTKPRAVCPGSRSFSERASPRPRCPRPGAIPTPGPPRSLPPQALAEASRSDLATGSSTKPCAVCPGPRSFSERASPRPRHHSNVRSPLLFRRRRLLKLRAPTLPPARPPNRARCAPDREASASERRRDRGAQARRHSNVRPPPAPLRRRRLLKLRAPTLPPARPPNCARCAPDREASASERRRGRGAQAAVLFQRPAPARSLAPRALAEASRSDLATGLVHQTARGVPRTAKLQRASVAEAAVPMPGAIPTSGPRPLPCAAGAC
jgi:hypothetical protein